MAVGIFRLIPIKLKIVEQDNNFWKLTNELIILNIFKKLWIGQGQESEEFVQDLNSLILNPFMIWDHNGHNDYLYAFSFHIDFSMDLLS